MRRIDLWLLEDQLRDKTSGTRRPEVKAGTLVQILRGYKLPAVEVNALFPSGPRPSAKVRALVDYLVKELKSQS